MSTRAGVEVRVPGDKSITHRALLFAGLAEGESRLAGLLDSADTRSTAAALRALGVELPRGPLRDMTVRGRGLHGWREAPGPLDCGNSGTTARLLLGALAGAEIPAVLTGDASLRRRPMRRVTGPLSAAGARFEELEAEDRLPIRVRGRRPLAPIDHFNAHASAQVKSALLLAGLTGNAPVRVSEPHPSRDHTERLLGAMGAEIRTSRTERGSQVSLQPTDALTPLDIDVPGDFSSAAFFLALGALHGELRVRRVGTNPSRTGMLDVLRRMGGNLAVEGTGEVAGEVIGDIIVRRSGLRGVTVHAEEVPGLIDEIPILAALAAVAGGESSFRGVAELRVKESDRVRALADNLTALGVAVEAGPDHLTVRGADRALDGTVESFGDHRIAMAFGVLAALPGNRIDVRGRDAVAVSYPDFWNELERVREELLRQ